MSILQVLLILFVASGTLIGVVVILINKHLLKAKNRLGQLTKQNIAREKELSQKIERAQKEAKSIMEKADIEREKVMADAKEDAERMVILTKESAEKEKEITIKKCKEDFERLKKDLQLKMDKRSITSACEIVKRLFSGNMKNVMHNHLVSEVIDDLKGLENEKFDIKTDTGKVITPVALNLGQKSSLESIIFEKSNKKITLEEEIDEDLALGLKLNIGSLIIDCSLKNKLDGIVKIN